MQCSNILTIRKVIRVTTKNDNFPVSHRFLPNPMQQNPKWTNSWTHSIFKQIEFILANISYAYCSHTVAHRHSMLNFKSVVCSGAYAHLLCWINSICSPLNTILHHWWFNVCRNECSTVVVKRNQIKFQIKAHVKFDFYLNDIHRNCHLFRLFHNWT